MSRAPERIAALLLDRFAGRTDCYLLEAKPRARTVHEPLTEALVLDHLYGRKRIGIFPDSSTSYLGFDFDGKNLPGGADEAFQHEQKVDAVLDADLGLPPAVLELTRSGLGYRVHVFFGPENKPTVEEQKAFGLAVLRAAGLPDDENEKLGHPGVYPHTTGPKGVGKTVYLPLGGLFNGGVSRFLDPVTREPLERQESVLEDAQLVSRDQIITATKQLAEAERERHAVSRTSTIKSTPTDSGVIERPADEVARHGVLWDRAVRWANAGLGEIEIRTFVFHLAEKWGLIAEGRGGEVEDIVRGAMLKAKSAKTDEEPIIELPYPADLYGELFTPRRPDFDVKNFIRRSGLVLAWSAPGGHKTHMAMVLCHQMLSDTGTGRLFGHPGLWINRRWKRVLWIATEECGDELRFQAEEVRKGLGIDKLDGELHYLFASRARRRVTLENLLELIERDGPWDAIILDSLTGLRPKVVNGVSVKWDVEADAVNEMCLMLRGLAAEHNICFLILHHSGRDTTRYRGSVEWWSSSDTMFGLLPDNGRVKVEVEKVRGGKKSAAFALEPEWCADGSFTMTYAGAADPVVLSPTAKTIKAYMQGARTASATEMIKNTGCSRSSGKTAIDILVDKKILRPTGTSKKLSPVYIYQEVSEVSDDAIGHVEHKE